MRRLKYARMLVWPGVLVFCLAWPALSALPTKQEVIDTMILVNDYWINGHPNPGDNQWARATYFEGNMAMFAVYPDQRYYNYALAWAESHNWHLNGGDTTRNADNQCAGQTYLDLYVYDPDLIRIAHIQASIDNMVDSAKEDDWYWIDALQMAMPVFAWFGAMYSDTDYCNKMYDLYYHTKYERGGSGRALMNCVDWLADACEGDFEPNGDTDGRDLAWLNENGEIDVDIFAEDFGRTDCR